MWVKSSYQLLTLPIYFTFFSRTTFTLSKNLTDGITASSLSITAEGSCFLIPHSSLKNKESFLCNLLPFGSNVSNDSNTLCRIVLPSATFVRYKKHICITHVWSVLFPSKAFLGKFSVSSPETCPKSTFYWFIWKQRIPGCRAEPNSKLLTSPMWTAPIVL